MRFPKVNELMTVIAPALFETVRSVKIGVGKLNGILIGGSRSFHTGDELTIKLRTERSTEVLVNRMSFEKLEQLHDLNYGASYSGGNRALRRLYLDARGTDFTVAEAEALEERINVTSQLYVDLGHITLDEHAELEVIVTVAGTKSWIETLSVSSVYHSAMVDIYKLLDETDDRNATHQNVRNIYLWKDSGFTVDGFDYADVDIQVDDKRQSYLMDIRDAYAATVTFGNVEQYVADNTVAVFGENGPLPADVRLKLTGADVEDVTVIVEREIIPLGSVDHSAIDNARDLLDRIVALERKNPKEAEAYRHAGKISKSSDLEKGIERVTNG